MKMILWTLNVGFFAVVSASAKVPTVTSTSYKIGDDVIVYRMAPGETLSTTFSTPASPKLSSCRQRIKEVVCWVEPPTETTNLFQRKCLSGSEKFVPYFEAHFDRSSDLIKKMYCHLEKVWVEKDFFGTAFASPVMSLDGKMIAGAIGIRQEALETTSTLDDWLSWKEETTFGGSPKSSDPRLGLISYKSNLATKEFLLDYILDHEFGHLFDFANQLNQVTDCKYEETSPGHWKRTCVPFPNTWGALSWMNTDNPKPDFDFAYRADICFYLCNGNYLDRSLGTVIFKGLTNSPFPSTYAARHPAEDWAESFALYLAHNFNGLQYSVTVEGQFFDLTAHFYSDKLEPKRNYIKKFLSGPILYPGDTPSPNSVGLSIIEQM